MSPTFLKNSPKDFAFYPLLWLAAFFAAGIFFAHYFFVDWKIFLVIALISSAFSIVFIKRKFASLFIFIAFFAIGSFYFQISKQNLPRNSLKNLYDTNQINSGDSIEIEGVLQGRPELAVGGIFLSVKVEKYIYKSKTKDANGNVRLFAPIQSELIQNEYEKLDLRYGTRIRIATNLKREEKFLNAGGISFIEILDQQGVDANGTIKSPLLIERIEDTKTFAPLAWLYNYRQSLIESISQKFNISTSGILIASLLGNRNHLTKDTAGIFREGGTFHVLVISGLHITFIGGLLLLIIRKFTRNKFWQFILVSVFLWGYSLAVGAEIPVLRAALMFTILLFSQVIYRNGTLLNALGACALALLIWRPQDLFNPSFHLTFASLFGIIAVAFPLIEKLRLIGNWTPSAENPFPPNVSKQLKIFCETLYWSEKKWQKTLNENIWDCQLFKSKAGVWLENRGLQKFLRWMFEGILVTAIVQLFLLPFLIFYFHRVSFASVLLNLWVGVFIVLQNLTAIIALFFATISNALALPFIKLTEIFNWFLLFVPKIFIENNLASFRVPIYSNEMQIVYVLYFIPLVILTILLNQWNPFSFDKSSNKEDKSVKLKKVITGKKIIIFHLSTFLLFLTLIILHPYSSPKADGRLKVDFLDVGQGDSALVTFPNGETLLIDGGGRHNFSELYVEQENGEKELFQPDVQGVGETVVSEFLWEKGYSKVDYLLATHADADHIQGLINVAKNFQIKAAMIGKEDAKDKDFIEFQNIFEKKNVSILNIFDGDSFEIGGVKIEVLNPTKQDINSRISSNNNSIVLRLTFGGREFLFTGDIEKNAEKRLLENPSFLQADIVKVAHHGSRTSSIKEFIEATKAEYAIIPVGRKSPFGHPHKEVSERWKKSGARVLTTGERGTITVSTNGKDLHVIFYR